MSDLGAALAAKPWILALAAASIAIWVLAVWTIFRSEKFVRKWLWVLLTLVTFTVRWSLDGQLTVAVGIPLGALYVLGFARWGRWPTAEEIAARAISPHAPIASRRAVVTLHLAYAAFAAAFAAMMLWLQLGPVMSAMLGAVGDTGSFGDTVRMAMAAFSALMLAFLIFLAVRPYPWAKLVCAFAAVAWLGHGLMSLFIMPAVLGPAFPAVPHAAFTAGAGVVAAVCGVIHLRIDRRLAGPRLRAA